jgi:hypothetical protein
MAEVGLLPFAGVALEVATVAVPAYRSRSSKHQFRQPQLLAILCLTRYEDWTYREAEVRLGEHQELRRALGLRTVPDHTTLHLFLKRLPQEAIDRAPQEVVRRLPDSGRRRSRRARVAVDATGLAQGSVSTFFVQRRYHYSQQPLPWRRWLNWVIVADLDRQLVLAHEAHPGPWNDSPPASPGGRGPSSDTDRLGAGRCGV